MSRLWQTDGQWKVMQYFVWAESANLKHLLRVVSASSPLQALKLKLMICCEYYLEVDTAVVYNAVCIDVHYVENVYPWPQIV